MSATSGVGTEFVRDGIAAYRRHDYRRAEQIYAAWTRSEPGNADAWNNLAVMLKLQRKFAAALACCRRALALAPDNLLALGNLGNLLKTTGRPGEACRLLESALERAPDDAGLHYNLACALSADGRVEAALAVVERAIALDPANGQYRFDRAVFRLRLGDYLPAWTDFEYRWSHKRARARKFQAPLWDGSDLRGKRLFIHAEQGFGDNLLAARFLPAIQRRGAYVILECRPELLSLFRGLAGVDECIVEGEREPQCDWQCPIMSLLGRCRATLESIPPPAVLVIPEDARERARSVLSVHAAKVKVGVSWSGSVTFADNHTRATGVERFLDFAVDPRVQLFSLQLGPPRRELAATGASNVVVDLGDHLNDFADTAAFVAGLDLVIMTDTSVAHLAGSLGSPVWNLLEFAPYWPYGCDGDRTAWYPSMRLFRQSAPGDWDSVFESASAALTRFVEERASSPLTDGT